MNPKVQRMKILVDGKLERDLYFIPKGKNSVRVFGDDVMPSEIYYRQMFMVKIFAEHAAMKRYPIGNGNKIEWTYDVV